MFSTAEKVRKCSFISEPSFYIHLLFLLEKKVPWSCLLKTLLVQVSGADGNQTAPFWQKAGRVMGELTETAPTQRDLNSSTSILSTTSPSNRILKQQHRSILDFLLSTVPIYLFSHQPNPRNLVQQLLAKHAEMQSDPVILRLKLKKQMMVSCRV